MNPDILEARYPHIVAMREFATEADYRAWQEKNLNVPLWATNTNCGKPDSIYKFWVTEMVHHAEWEKRKALNLPIPIPMATTQVMKYSRINSDLWYHHDFVEDLMNSFVKSVFTSEEKAQTYYNACLQAFNSDGEWQSQFEFDNESLNMFDD